MLATEQECSENTDARGDRIDRVSQREVCEGLQQGIVGFSFCFVFTNPIGSTCNTSQRSKCSSDQIRDKFYLPKLPVLT